MIQNQLRSEIYNSYTEITMDSKMSVPGQVYTVTSSPKVLHM